MRRRREMRRREEEGGGNIDSKDGSEIIITIY